MTALAQLGTALAAVEKEVSRSGLFSRRPEVARTDYLDWTADGVPIRELFERANPGFAPVEESTLVPPSGPLCEHARDRVRALLGETGGTTSDTVFADGRVGILFCTDCGGLDCSTLGASSEFADETVTWRDIEFQVDWLVQWCGEKPGARQLTADEPYSLGDQTGVTLTFARKRYEAVVREVLER